MTTRGSDGITRLTMNRITLVVLLVAPVILCPVLGAGFTPGSIETGGFTFSRDVAPILYKHCAECHRPNDVAPFSVLTYKAFSPGRVQSAKKLSLARCLPGTPIRVTVNSRTMPMQKESPAVGDRVVLDLLRAPF